jgi:hypothetical protein
VSPLPCDRNTTILAGTQYDGVYVFSDKMWKRAPLPGFKLQASAFLVATDVSSSRKLQSFYTDRPANLPIKEGCEAGQNWLVRHEPFLCSVHICLSLSSVSQLTSLLARRTLFCVQLFAFTLNTDDEKGTIEYPIYEAFDCAQHPSAISTGW